MDARHGVHTKRRAQDKLVANQTFKRSNNQAIKRSSIKGKRSTIMSYIQNLFTEFIGENEPVVLARNEYLLKEGEVERFAYFIADGALRVFLVSEFEEHTIRFGYKDSIITSLSSFITGKPSEFYLQAIRKTTVYKFPKEQFLEKVHSTESGVREYNAMLQNLVLQQMEREVDLLTHSPAERLKRVMERSPQLFQEIPSKYVASYLRMTPETLSRLGSR